MSLILEENKRRNAILDAEYNPYLGIGSTIERQLLSLSDLQDDLWLPLSMMNLDWIQELAGYGSMDEYVRRTKHRTEVLATDYHPIETFQEIFLEERLNHDFEYWAATCVKIKPKKGGNFIPFILNPPQRILLFELEEMRLGPLAIFFILLKSRQFGGSTLIQVYMLWIQIRLKTNWNSLIAAHIKQAARNVRSMVTNLIKEYPKEIDVINLKAFEGETNVKIIPERSNKIAIGSMQVPDSIRSDDVKMAHLTEVGLWKKTEGKEPEDMIQAILGTVSMQEPYNLLGIESTAKGVGNYFHRTWQQAYSGKNGFKPIFIPWYKDQKNRAVITSNKEIESIFSTLNSYELFLWKTGATIEGIKFYRMQLAVFNNDKWRMQSEFPTTPEEAFQSTGNRYFPQEYVLALRKDNKEPIFKGEIIADSTMGEKALENIRFEENERGNLWIWEFPDKDNEYEDRYIIPMDIGGASKDADFSIIRVIDKLPMLTGGDPKLILTWKGHIDQDLLSWKGAQISKIYGNGLFTPEDNSMDKDTDGEHFFTILDTIKDHYKFIYIRNNVEKVGNDFVPKYGWQTNKRTKGLALDALKSCARERMNKDLEEEGNGRQDGYGCVEYDERNCSEMDCMEIKPNGSVGAVDGEHDDECMTSAIGLRVAIHETPLPRLRKKTVDRVIHKRRSESSF